jgi:hypothetical protein
MTGSKNLGLDVGTHGGDWLFRQGELVLGPLPAHQLVEKLFHGEVDAKTPVSLLGENAFRPLGQVDFFKVHLAKAEAKRRVDAVAHREHSASSRRRGLKITILVVSGLLCSGTAAYFAKRTAEHRDWQANQEAFSEFGDISVEAPIIALASARLAEEDEGLDYPSEGGGTAGTAKAGARKSDKGRADRRTAAAQRTGKVGEAPPPEPDGLTTEQFDRGSINAVVAAKQKTLYPCIAEVAKTKPGVAATIPIEFVIGNDGKVTEVWVDNKEFKQEAFSGCLLRELQKWKFSKYDGERATVGLSFRIGKGK